MNTELDNRTALINLIEKMDGFDLKQLIAFAAGFEAAKTDLSLKLSQSETDHPSIS